MNYESKKILSISALIIGIIVFFVVASFFLPRFFLRDMPLGDRQEALKRAGDLPYLSNRVAQEEILAALIETKNIALCNHAEGVVVDGIDYFSLCVSNINFQLAQETNNPKLCKNISPSFYDPSACEQEVLSAQAIIDQDPEVCRSGSAETIIRFCERNYFSALAQTTNDTQACKNLSEEDSESCFVGFVRASFLRNKTADCSLLSGEYRLGCESLRRVVQSGVTGERCDSLKRSYFKSVCFELIEQSSRIINS